MRIIALALAAIALFFGHAQGQPRQRQSPISYIYLYGEGDYFTDSGAARGGGGGLGLNVNRYFGLQAGAQLLTQHAPYVQYGPDNSADATLLYGEAKLSWPWTDNWSVYASAGLAYVDATSTLTTPFYPRTTYTGSKEATGYRIGLGTEYWFGRHWGVRAGWRQINVIGVGSDLSAGVAFRF